MELRPLGNRVIVERHKEKTVSDGGIHIPEKVAKLTKPVKGNVLAVGPGRYLDNGELIPINLKVGDVVLFGINAGQEIEVDDEKILVLQGDEILAVYPND